MAAIESTTTPINTGAVSFASAAAPSGTDIDALAAEVTSAQVEVTNATAAVTNATAEVARAQATLAEAMSVLAEAKNILATVEAALAAHLANQPEHFIWEEQKNGTMRRIVNPQFTNWLAQKRTLESQVRAARAAVAAAERAVTQAERGLEAAKQRLEVAKQKLETAKAKVRAAQQRVERARAELERRRRELELMRGLKPQEQAFVAAEITQLDTILQWNADAALQAASRHPPRPRSSRSSSTGISSRPHSSTRSPPATWPSTTIWPSPARTTPWRSSIGTGSSLSPERRWA